MSRLKARRARNPRVEPLHQGTALRDSTAGAPVRSNSARFLVIHASRDTPCTSHARFRNRSSLRSATVEQSIHSLTHARTCAARLGPCRALEARVRLRWGELSISDLGMMSISTIASEMKSLLIHVFRHRPAAESTGERRVRVRAKLGVESGRESERGK